MSQSAPWLQILSMARVKNVSVEPKQVEHVPLEKIPVTQGKRG